jgi:hypothetical protein
MTLSPAPIYEPGMLVLTRDRQVGRIVKMYDYVCTTISGYDHRRAVLEMPKPHKPRDVRVDQLSGRLSFPRAPLAAITGGAAQSMRVSHE